MGSFLDGYKAFVRQNRQWLSSVESLASTLTWLLPERLANSELAPEALSTAIGLLSVLNTYIVDASPGSASAEAHAHAGPHGRAPSPSSPPGGIPWGLWVGVAKEVEVLGEMTAEYCLGEESKWGAVAGIEATKALLRLIIFCKSGGKMLLEGGQTANEATPPGGAGHVPQGGGGWRGEEGLRGGPGGGRARTSVTCRMDGQVGAYGGAGRGGVGGVGGGREGPRGPMEGRGGVALEAWSRFRTKMESASVPLPGQHPQSRPLRLPGGSLQGGQVAEWPTPQPGPPEEGLFAPSGWGSPEAKGYPVAHQPPFPILSPPPPALNPGVYGGQPGRALPDTSSGHNSFVSSSLHQSRPWPPLPRGWPDPAASAPAVPLPPPPPHFPSLPWSETPGHSEPSVSPAAGLETPKPDAQWSQHIRSAGELLHILRPLIYVALIRRYGRKSWRPWLASAAMDLGSLALIWRGTAAEGKEGTEGGAAGDQSGGGLRPLEREEVQRRRLLLALYLMRSPCFDAVTRRPLEGVQGVLQPVPLVGTLAEKAVELLVGIQGYYFYTSAS